MSYPLLTVERLNAGYERGANVLHDIDLQVGEHEVVTILGSNGAGKTTLANAISGIVPHLEGRIRFAGEVVAGLPPHELVARGIAHAPSGREVFPDLSVQDNLLVGAHAYRSDRRRMRRALDATLERFDALARRRSQAAGTLSGGEQQLLSIARALMGRPRLLILDEPSMGLAPATVDAVFDEIRRIRAGGVTILMIEKLARVAAGLSDRLVVMQLGRITLEGPAERVAADPRVAQAYLGRPNPRNPRGTVEPDDPSANPPKA